ncbi:MAG: type II toxin-antitoxin system death-on-curing family toxin [Actinobacteria bacterium]|nr:type II toxin-antitoxin system death-on-curing family toxin [Actinomycetota bacterium]
MEYLTVEDVMIIHHAETRQTDPIVDFGLLGSAVMRPQQSVGGQDAYPGVHLKAAALMHSLARNHPFVDGNKRTAAVAALTFCFINGQMIVMDDSELVALTLDVAEGQLDVPTIAKRLEDRSVEIENPS